MPAGRRAQGRAAPAAGDAAAWSAGVRDYGNRMGIPTVNGAVYFDDRYLGNPLVFCGSVGLIPRDKCVKQPQRRAT